MSITLVQYRRGMGVPNLSAFCMKAEILLKLAGMPYTIEETDDPRKTPKGKLPLIRDDGHDIADSTFIQKHLERKYGIDFYAGYDAEARALGHAIARMSEERLYWAFVYSRWIEPENWPTNSDFWFAGLPPIIRSLVPILARKQVKSNLQAQGLGRHSRAEIYALAKDDIDAIATTLADKNFVLGDTPTAVDATVYGMIENGLIETFKSPILEITQAHGNLIAYASRCRALWFADL